MTTSGRKPQEQRTQFRPGAQLRKVQGAVICLGKVSTLRTIPTEDGSFKTVPEITLFCSPSCIPQTTPEKPKD
jgi:hypothetical protein